MDGKKEIRRKNKKLILIENYKGQKHVEAHYRLGL